VIGAWDISEMHTKIWLENLKARSNFEDLIMDGRIILNWILYGFK
jgi:hypothetical protein